MKKTLVLFFLLLLGQTCSGMSHVLLGRELINKSHLLVDVLEPNRLMRGANIGLSTTLLLVAFKYMKKTWPKAIFKPISLPFMKMDLKDLLKIHAHLPHLITALLVFLIKSEQIDIAEDVFVRNAISIIVGISNSVMFDYYDYCYQAKKKSSLAIKSKIAFDPEFIAEHTCRICWEALREPINPCAKKDHLFCAECLAVWFKRKEENTEADDKSLFKCDLCKLEISQNSPKLVIDRTGYNPNTKDFIKTLIGSKGAMIILLACNFCYLIFLIAS